ncbi:hypothetical protein PLICRDRAFT_279019 [Plicaturopsis crispa FD-325 SS-3]|nr:hypothetical protein PLICRDRAFT_279019 [Plicaturopsis crispa FD-325 SS-3]
MATNNDLMQFLFQLSDRIEHAPLGEVTIEMIAPIFNHLDPAEIPVTSIAPPSPDSHARVHLAINSLVVIISCDDHLCNDPVLVARLLECWPRVWKWIQFLHDECIVEKAYGEGLYTNAIFTLGATLQTLGRPTTSRDQIARTPGLLALIVKEWIDDRIYPDTSVRMELGGVSRAFTVALDVFLDRKEGTLESIVPQILDAANGDAKKVAGTVLMRLREAVAAGSIEQIESHLSLANKLSDTACPPLHLALLTEGAIPAVIRVLSWHNSQPLRVAPTTTGVMLLCYYNLIDNFRSMNVPSWAVQAIDSGLIPALLRSARIRGLDDPKLAAPLLSFFLELLPKYLIYRSVLRAVRRALRQVNKHNLGEAVSGALGDAWQDFEMLAEDRLWLLEEWDCEGERDRYRSCSRSLCDNGDSNATKRCSGCLGPMYCSKECQKLDWPAHKRGCKAARQILQEGRRVPIDPLDHEFLRYIADHEVRCRLPGIIKDAHAAGTPLSTIVLELDYSDTPSGVFRVRNVSDYSPAAGEPPLPVDDPWQATLDYAQASGGERMAMRTVTMEGQRETLWTGTINIQHALALAPTL